jgi:hypothetical protein
VQKPSDIDPEFSDEGYELPPLDVRWHEVPSDHSTAGRKRSGQNRLFRNARLGVQARERSAKPGARIAKMLELRSEDPARIASSGTISKPSGTRSRRRYRPS